MFWDCEFYNYINVYTYFGVYDYSLSISNLNCDPANGFYSATYYAGCSAYQNTSVNINPSGSGYSYYSYNSVDCTGPATISTNGSIPCGCSTLTSPNSVNPGGLVFTSSSYYYTLANAVPNICPGGSTCFAGSSQVILENGDSKLISDVVIGDRVLSYSSKSQVLVYLYL